MALEHERRVRILFNDGDKVVERRGIVIAETTGFIKFKNEKTLATETIPWERIIRVEDL